MIVITEPKTFTTPNAAMTTFAAPSRGSIELAAWRVRMDKGASGPEHTIDREQVWLPLSGSLTVSTAGESGESIVVGPGESVVLPAGESRRISTPHGPAEALVCMPAGGVAEVADGIRPLPWAQ